MHGCTRVATGLPTSSTHSRNIKVPAPIRITGPLAALVTPLAHASSTPLNVVAAVLAGALVGAYVALAVLLLLAVLRVVRPRLDGHP